MMEAKQVPLGANGDDSSRAPPLPSSSRVEVPAPGAEAPAPEGADALPFKYLEAQLVDAEGLVKYAAEAGIDIGDWLRREVLAARMAAASGWTEVAASRLLANLTRLTTLLKPVSGESLRKCVDAEASATIRNYRRWAFGLGFLILPYSVTAFVAAATCETIRKDIEVANGLAVTLGGKISPAFAAQPAPNAPTLEARPHGESELKDLQQLASTIRDIRARARRLMFLGSPAGSGQDPARFELPVPISNFSAAAADAIRSYQHVRYFAQSVQETVSTRFGALTSCLLPTFYALLGACAYLIRLFEGQIKARTFTGMQRPTTHFLAAAIGGFVVGLFGDFGTGQGAVLPPLATAFLVGYGVDAFFSFLDRVLMTLGRPPADPTSAPRAN